MIGNPQQSAPLLQPVCRDDHTIRHRRMNLSRLLKPGLLLSLSLGLSLGVHNALAAERVSLSGTPIQGGLLRGQSEAGAQVFWDEQSLVVGPAGEFLCGFGRDDTAPHQLRVLFSDGSSYTTELRARTRDYSIERVDGVPQDTVTPPPELTERINREAALVSQARRRRDQRSDWQAAFIWPAQGRLSGFYGSQRILNGVPKRPHFGLDVAAPSGTPVQAPAAGIVTLAEPDLFYSGGTIIIDHGHGLSSSFLHLSQVSVSVGQTVAQGDSIGAIGATGRASGPHLDWRMNWLGQQIDPQLLVPAMEPAAAPAE